jgi:alpha-glucosidase
LLIIPQWAKNPTLPKGIWKSVSIAGEKATHDEFQPEIKQRGGSIIPIGQIIQSTAAYNTDSLTLLVCLDSSKYATGKLYSDAGEGFEYKKGDYELDYFTAQASENKVVTVSCVIKGGNLINRKRFYRIGLVTDDGIKFSDWQNENKLPRASPRGIKKANAQGESGTDPRVGVLNQKENKIKFKLMN